MTPSPTTPSGERAGILHDLGTLVDHSWLVGDGVLFCVAGSIHAATAIPGCAYWIRADLAAQVITDRDRERLAPSASEPKGKSLTFRGQAYWKLPALAQPGDWPTVHNRLSTQGIAPLSRSLLAIFDPAAVLDIIEPRAAIRAVAAGHGVGSTILRALLAALGDPDAKAGLLGLTGSAALDANRLASDSDLDLLTYPDLTTERLAAAIARLGGVFLADLKPGDPRRRAFDTSRFLPGRPRASRGRDQLWSRRRDVAWIGTKRLDLTAVPATARLAEHIPFAGADLGPAAITLDVAVVDPGYPVQLVGSGNGEQTTVWITARGYDAVLRPGDRVRLSGRLRHALGSSPGNHRLVTVDDWPGHHLHLEAVQ